MASFDEDSSWFRAAFADAKHAVRDFAYACARLPFLPVYRLTNATVPLPGGVKRIYCYHLRKTGGTTFAHAFLALGGEEPGVVERRMKNPPFSTRSGSYRFAYQDPPLLRHGYFFFGYGHKPAETLRLPAQTFTVTILRDPAERVVSLYRYLADPRADEGHPFHALEYEREWARYGFGRFLDLVSRQQLLNQLYTFSLAGDRAEAAERIAACDRVMTTDKLDDGIEELGRFLGLPLQPRRVRQSLLEYEPTEAEAARLRELLVPEYEMLSLLAQRSGVSVAGAGTTATQAGA